ncbi:hypothetical protein DFJ73DRAFT_837046 [Zopfochytrium polystomum]|nr:hypothetical protein DFJ73DRAFT_837046 [Zopfochytrium polystomum]
MLDPAVKNSNQMLTSCIFQFVEVMIVISSIFGPPLRLMGTRTLQLFVAICQASATILRLCLLLSSNIWICFAI